MSRFPSSSGCDGGSPVRRAPPRAGIAMMQRIRRPFLAAVALVLASCAPTTIRDSWHDPEYRGAAFRNVLVLGVFPNIAERRQYEDVMAATIDATGARGIPAYRFLPGQERASEADLDRAVRESGADALLMSRLVGVDTHTQVSTQRVSPRPGTWASPAPGAWGWGGWYSGWWGAGWQSVTTVTQYDIAVVETTLFSAASGRVVWTGVTDTFQPRSMAREAPEFAATIVGALQAPGLLPAAK